MAKTHINWLKYEAMRVNPPGQHRREWWAMFDELVSAYAIADFPRLLEGIQHLARIHGAAEKVNPSHFNRRAWAKQLDIVEREAVALSGDHMLPSKWQAYYEKNKTETGKILVMRGGLHVPRPGSPTYNQFALPDDRSDGE